MHNLEPHGSERVVPRPNRVFFSVVVPTRNRPLPLKACIKSLADQTYSMDKFEVIICDDASDYDIQSVVQLFSDKLQIRYLRTSERRGPATCRNMGWKIARGDWVLFVDDDEVASPTYLSSIAEAVNQAEAEIIGFQGPILPLVPTDTSNPFIHTFRVTSIHNLTGNMALRRSVLELVGGFDEAFPHNACEDYDLVWRVLKMTRGRFGWVPQAIVYHPVLERSVSEWINHLRRANPSVLRLYYKHPERFPPLFLPQPYLDVLRKIVFRKPALASIVIYLILNRLAWFFHHRYVWFERPRLAIRGIGLVLGCTLTLVRDLPQLWSYSQELKASLPTR